MSFKPSGSCVVDEFFVNIRKHGVKRLHEFGMMQNMTTATLNGVLRAHTGCSSQWWKTWLIVFDADWYLLRTPLTVKEIAEKLHFTSANNFSTYYKRHRDLVPAHFRQKYRKVEIVHKYIALDPFSYLMRYISGG